MKIPISLIALCLLATTTFSHSDHDKKKDTAEVELPDTAIQKQEFEVAHEPPAHEHNESSQNKPGTASFDDFPSMHPLVVHFPIVLLLLAAIAQLFSFFVFKEQLSWVTLALATGGLIGAFAAAEFVHPHTTDLSESAAWVLEQHETYADYTLWLAGLALLMKIASHFFLKRKRWIEAVVAIVLLASAYCVSVAGHHGSQLTHIEGVGPQGEYLEIEDHDH